MLRNLPNLIIVSVILLVITACVCRSDRDKQSNSAPDNSAEIADTQQAANKAESKIKTDSVKRRDEGDFTVEHVPVENARYEEIDRQIKDEKLLEKAADKLNRSLILPYDIALRTKDCGEINSFYNADDHSVTVCYELMEHFFKLFRLSGDAEQKAYDKMFDAVQFVFLHEIGHALIDAYKLPVMGNEEDAADRCSAFINLKELGDEGVRSVLAASDAFAAEAKNTAPNERNPADEHLLQEQRFYNTLCLAYGSNPAKYEYLVSEGYLPKDRAVRCPNEYQRTVESWVKLLEEWRKN